jgi:hypothetical protein
MAEETLRLVPARVPAGTSANYVVNFNGVKSNVGGVHYQFGRERVNGPVAYKTATDSTAMPLLRREADVARFLDTAGGELLSRCVAHQLDRQPLSTLVTHRGSPLDELIRTGTHWPPGPDARTKMVNDLLQALELLRISRIVHGGISLRTVLWDGSTLLLTDFGRAALNGTYPDGRPAHHGDDIQAAGRVVYEILTGEPPPADPHDLRRQIEQVQDPQVRDLLLHRDLATGADVDYAFAAEPADRPTARQLLDRMDRRHHGVQPGHVQAEEMRIRADFQRLRDQQHQAQQAYRAWVERTRPRPRPRPPVPLQRLADVIGGRSPEQFAEQPVIHYEGRDGRPITIVAGAILLIILVIGLLL